MTDVRIRKVEDWVLDSLRRQAKLQGKSLENELRDILTATAVAKRQAIVEEMRVGLKELHDKYGTFSDSTILIREERDARG